MLDRYRRWTFHLQNTIKFIVLLFFTPLLLYANCTEQQMQQAQDLYNEARFEEALRACYSAEIEANMLIVKAEEQVDVHKKIAYYKEALIAISKFSNKEVLVVEQNRLNELLFTLYTPINQEVANIYRAKIQKKSETLKSEPSSMTKYIFYLIFSLLIFWGFLGVFKKN